MMPGGPAIAMQAVVTKSFAASAEFHHSARAFRNRLVVTSLLVTAICVVLVIVQQRMPAAHVFTRPSDAATVPRWALMMLIMLFGAVGALITAIPVLASIPRVKSPYNFPLQQSLVKIAVGGVTGLVGVMAIGNAGVAGFKTLQTLLAAAAVFGAGQQAVTRFLDKRAGQIIAKMPDQKE